MRSLSRPIVAYGVIFAFGALSLQWLSQQIANSRNEQLLLLVLAIVLAGLGIWVGRQFGSPADNTEFKINQPAIDYLGVSRRERDVLNLLAAGHSNQEIADQLSISLNTVKTHLRNPYQKLDVSRRGQAVEKARTLRLSRRNRQNHPFG